MPIIIDFATYKPPSDAKTMTLILSFTHKVPPGCGLSLTPQSSYFLLHHSLPYVILNSLPLLLAKQSFRFLTREQSVLNTTAIQTSW